MTNADKDRAMMEESERYVADRAPAVRVQRFGEHTTDVYFDAAQMRAAFRSGYDYARKVGMPEDADSLEFSAKHELATQLRACSSIEEIHEILAAIDGRHDLGAPDPDPVRAGEIDLPGDPERIVDQATHGVRVVGDLPSTEEQAEAAQRAATVNGEDEQRAHEADLAEKAAMRNRNKED